MKICIDWSCDSVNEESQTLLLELNQDGFYVVDYPNIGKKEILRILDFDFEVLFEVGSNAFLDHYFREAVSSFSASLERFYEFYIRTILLSKNLGWAKVDDLWKTMKNQSERQIGAFSSLYFAETGRGPNLLPDKWRSFRNNVIHKGLIPDRIRTAEYGNEIGTRIVEDYKYLLKHHRESIGEIHKYNLGKRNEMIPDLGEIEMRKYRISTIVVASVISSWNDSLKHPDWSFEKGLNGIRGRWLKATAHHVNSTIKKYKGS